MGPVAEHAFPHRALRLVAAVLEHGEAVHGDQKPFEFRTTGAPRQISSAFEAAHVFPCGMARDVRELVEERGDAGVDTLGHECEG